MQTTLFNRTRLATCLSLALGATMLPATVVAQEEATAEQDVEIIEVTGIRSSLIKSMDIKRGSNGVVDAITAEDIGKMPDANLAESLQRITGVSIDRSQSEGSKITVRGFGPEFNLVTLNGRQMPTTGGRSFDFADIATEGVSGVEVYKTADASKPSGGIGATVNINTAKPLSSPGLKASLGAKAVHMSSVEEGDEVTPEISGLFSNTFLDNKIGFLVSGSYSEINARQEGAGVDNWRPADFDADNADYWTPAVEDMSQINDNNTKDVYWYAQNAGYNISDFERKRTNAQAVFQYAPTDELTATVDYTYSKVERNSEGVGVGVWFTNNPLVSATVNENGTFTDVTERGGDYATNLNRSESVRENKSLGINIEWQATDTLSFELDAHTSEATDEGEGLGQDAFLIIGNTSCGWCGGAGPEFGPGTANIDLKSASFANGELPIWDLSFLDAEGNPQAELTGADMGSLFGASILNGEENDMDQVQLHGTWVNESDSALTAIRFGGSYTDMTFRSTNRYSEQLPAGWWNWSAVHFDDDMFEKRSLNGILDDFDNGGSFPVDYYMWADFDAIKDRFENIEDTIAPGIFNPGWPSELNGVFSPGPIDNDHSVNEETIALYTQFDFETEFNDFPISMVVGLRYEQTDVTSSSLERPATAMRWINGNEWGYIFDEETSFSEGTGKTREFLPNFDLAVDITDDIIGRFSYSRTMARPGIGSLRAVTDFLGNPKVGQRRVAKGNPDLQPYLADNVDLSLEYYYEEGSYASVGYFRKNVDNFLVNQTTKETVNGIVDPYYGEGAEAAREALTAAGEPLSDENIHTWMVDNGYANEDGHIISNPETDPLAVFDVSRDTNVEKGTLWGWELAAQHMFGTTGFGVTANATFVYGDIEADRETIGYQFALPGLSDSANLSLIYDDDIFSTRLSYNWRDEFLSGFDQYSSPVFVESYGQWDINMNYKVTENFTVFVEGLNITEETQRSYVRYSEQFLSGNQYGARYNIGARYTF